jgi:4-amino-4-deoxy-L-arabinose transferase-like glycosyltransferase
LKTETSVINLVSFSMSRTDWFAFALALLAILLSNWVSFGVYEGLAQLEDEYAYQWQAQISTQGDLKIPSPPEPQEFFVTFVIDHEGARFGKYPLGWPVMLSFGERLGLIRFVNPLLAALAVWLIYRLGQKLLGDRVGLLAALLMTISPLFLTYTGSILSHTWGLVLSLILAVSWLDINNQRDDLPGWLPTLVAGLSLGVLALSRPWTALGVAIPFGIHGIIRLWRGPNIIRKKILAVGVITLLVASLHFLWQFALTGDPLQNPYLLWWPYDKIGFGPGAGTLESGHTIHQGWVHTKRSLAMTWEDLWGWGRFSWILLFLGLWAVRRQPRVWLIASVFPSLVIVYWAYWVSGPRYFYEGLFSLMIVGAAGLAWLAGWMPGQEISSPRQARFRQGLAVTGLLLLILGGTLIYTPTRLYEIQYRYNFSEADLEPFSTPEAQEMTPALIILHASQWRDYGVYLHLQDPYLTSPFIFAWASSNDDPSDALTPHFPDRTIYHYYPDQPGEFYSKHLP